MRQPQYWVYNENALDALGGFCIRYAHVLWRPKPGENNADLVAVSALPGENKQHDISACLGMKPLVSIPVHRRHSLYTKSQRETRRIMTCTCRAVRISLAFPSAVPWFSKHYTRSSKVPNAARLQGQSLRSNPGTESSFAKTNTENTDATWRQYREQLWLAF